MIGEWILGVHILCRGLRSKYYSREIIVVWMTVINQRLWIVFPLGFFVLQNFRNANKGRGDIRLSRIVPVNYNVRWHQFLGEILTCNYTGWHVTPGQKLHVGPMLFCTMLKGTVEPEEHCGPSPCIVGAIHRPLQTPGSRSVQRYADLLLWD